MTYVPALQAYFLVSHELMTDHYILFCNPTVGAVMFNTLDVLLMHLNMLLDYASVVFSSQSSVNDWSLLYFITF